MERLYKTKNIMTDNIAYCVAGVIFGAAKLNFGWASPASSRAGYFWNLFPTLTFNPIFIRN